MKTAIESTVEIAGVMVSLFRRQPGGPLYYYFRVNGDRHRNTTKAFSDREARAIVRPIVISALQHKPQSPFAAMPFPELLTAYFDSLWPESDPENSVRKGNRTYQSAKSTLNAFAADAGEKTIFASLTFDEARLKIQQFVDRRKPHVEPRTLTNERGRISRLCSWIMRRQLHAPWIANPAAADRIEIPPMLEPEPHPFDDVELDMITTAGPESEVWPVIVLCLGAGCRPSEAIRAQWSDMDFERHIISVTNLKSNRTRYPVLNTWTETELQAWRAAHPEPAGVWPFNKFVAFDKMGDLRESLGMPEHITLQNLRETACTRAILSGMKLADYVMQFGHSLEVARRHYLRFGKAELASRREQMEAVTFKPGPEPVERHPRAFANVCKTARSSKNTGSKTGTKWGQKSRSSVALIRVSPMNSRYINAA